MNAGSTLLILVVPRYGQRNAEWFCGHEEAR